eukprot:171924_1
MLKQHPKKPVNRDYVQCVACHDYRCLYKTIESHWSVYRHRLTHPNITDKKDMYYQLEEPRVKTSRTIVPDDNDKQISCVMNELRAKSDTLKLLQFAETKNNGYQSIFDSLFGSAGTFGKTIVFLQCLMDMMDEKIHEVWDMPQLLLKYSFHGCRATEHELCKKNEILIYCNVCCKYPEYPENGIGNIITGRVEYKIGYKKRNNGKYWNGTKKYAKRHFMKDIQHWNNMNAGFHGHNTWDEKCELAIYHLITLMVRMTKSYQADRQYPFNCAMLKLMNVVIGNIGHSIYYIAKLRSFTNGQVS